MIFSDGSIFISGIGTYIPANCVTNDQLPAHLETSDEWINSRTGIRQRYIAPDGIEASDMAIDAAKVALSKAKLNAQDIDLIIVGTMSPDYPFPSTACIVQAKLGMRNVAAFDLHAACSGFIYILEVASRMMQSGAYKNALIIGAEKMSSVLDWNDRGTCVLFGDGAGAAVLSKTDTKNIGVIDCLLCADGQRPELLYCPSGGSVQRTDARAIEMRSNYLKMNGKEIFKVAVRLMTDAAEQILKRNGLQFSDVDCVIPHQANIRIIESLAKYAGIPMEKFHINIDRFANTSAASIPLALNEALENGRIQTGNNILLVAFGGGLTWATSLIKWH